MGNGLLKKQHSNNANIAWAESSHNNIAIGTHSHSLRVHWILHSRTKKDQKGLHTYILVMHQASVDATAIMLKREKSLARGERP